MRHAQPAEGARARSLQREVSDADLMRAIAAGDLSALGELYGRHHESMHQFARRAAATGSDAGDIVHDAFLIVPHAAAAYDGRACARPFLIGITAQIIRRRARAVARFWALLVELSEHEPDATPTPEDVVLRAEDLDRIDRALARLSEAKRLVYLMIEREGLSGEEVAAALEIPIGTVWTRLHHARAALLRSLLKGRGR